MTDRPIPFRKVSEEEVALMATSLVGRYQVSARCLDGTDLPSLAELHSGIPFRAGMWEADTSEWARRTLDEHKDDVCGPLPRGVVMALVRVLREQTRQTIGALRSACQRRQACWSDPFIERLVGMGHRCDVYLAAAGDEEARVRTGLAGLRGVNWRERGAASIGRLCRSIGMLAPALTEKRLSDLFHAAEVIESARTLGGVTDISAFQSAFFATQRDVLRGRTRTATERDDELPEPVIDEEIDLVTAVQEDRDRGAWAYEKPEQQHRVVFGRMDHLPRVSQLARERGDTPRAVVANLEGVPLPLKRLDADIIQVAYDLHSDYPWLQDVIDDIVTDLALAPAWLRFPRIIFAGPPGCGKTSLAIALGKSFGITATVYSAGGVADGMLSGTSRAWASGRLCVPAQAIAQARIANPLIIIDEVEKAGTSRHNGNLTDALLSLTEPTSSRQFFDPYLEAPIDLSAVSYLCTVNDPDLLPAPLRDRFRIVNVPAPGVEHLPAIVTRMVAEIRTERGVCPDFLPDLAPDEIGLLAEGWNANSMRSLRRSVVALLKSRERLATRN